jgi:oxalate decarboxylase/phosphoglucose isomerase-like protein (cupin superfamily)
MAKVDLKKSAGVSVLFDGKELIFNDTSPSKTFMRGIGEVKTQLLNKELTCPDIFYVKYTRIDNDDIFKKKSLKVNLYMVHPNLAGIEYVKTKASRSKHYPRILEVVYGAGLILLQKYENKFDNDIIKVVVKKNMKLIVPPGYSVCIVNTRQSTLVVSEISSINARIRTVLDDMNGMAYYVIRKNAKQELVRNPAYRAAIKPRKVDWDTVVSEYSITPRTPIIKQILRKYAKFKWLFNKKEIAI